MARKASRVEHGLRSPVSRELNGLTLVGGGRGVCIIVDRGNRDAWVSEVAGVALMGAAKRLGFGHEFEGWDGVCRALMAGCLPDVLSEAIEEQESVHVGTGIE